MVCAVSDDEHSAMRRVTHFASLAEICCVLYVNTGWRCLSSRFICHAALLASFMRQKHFTSRWPVTHYSGHCWSCHHCSEHNSECNWHSRSWCDCDHRCNFCIDYCAASWVSRVLKPWLLLHYYCMYFRVQFCANCFRNYWIKPRLQNATIRHYNVSYTGSC